MNRTRIARLLSAAFAAGTVALVISGCGSSAPRRAASAGTGSGTATTTTASPTTTSASTATSAPTTTAPPSPAPTTSATATTPAPPPGACSSSQLVASFLGQRTPMENEELGFELRNDTDASCTTYGFPGIVFLGRDGRPLPTSSTRTTSDPFGPTPEAQLTLAPGETASFRLWVQGVITGRAGCTLAYGLQVIPPNDTTPVRAAIPGGAWECGRTTVSPLQAGTVAYP